MTNKIKILLLDGHTVQTLAMAKALRQHSEYYITAMCEDKLSFGYFSRYPHKKVLCPKCITEPNKYLNNLIEFLSNDPHHVTIPLFNDTADIVSKHKTLLSKYTNVQIPDYDIFIRGYDKELTMEACKNAKIPHPKTMNPDKTSFADVIEYVGFPALIKPNIASGARGITRVESLGELINMFPKIVKEYGSCTVQEFIPQTGSQYKVQILRDKEGNCSEACVLEKYRYFPINGGSSCCNITIENNEIVQSSKELLRELNWVGFADFDFIEDPRDGLYKVMEINPRVPACIRSAFTSGLDFANAMVRQGIGKEIISVGKYFPGKVLRYMSLEILWFIFSKNRFAAKPNWFNFIGKQIYYEDGSLDDPIPMLVGFALGIKKYINPKFRRAKFGMKIK
jgi:D-aspartate ligase